MALSPFAGHAQLAHAPRLAGVRVASCSRLPASRSASRSLQGCIHATAGLTLCAHRAARRAERCRCGYRQPNSPPGAPERSEKFSVPIGPSSLRSLPAVQIFSGAALTTILLGVLTGPPGSPGGQGSLVVDIDQSIHQLSEALSPDHQFFGAWSNRLDDFAQLTAWILAGVSAVVPVSPLGIISLFMFI